MEGSKPGGLTELLALPFFSTIPTPCPATGFRCGCRTSFGCAGGVCELLGAGPAGLPVHRVGLGVNRTHHQVDGVQRAGHATDPLVEAVDVAGSVVGRDQDEAVHGADLDGVGREVERQPDNEDDDAHGADRAVGQVGRQAVQEAERHHDDRDHPNDAPDERHTDVRNGRGQVLVNGHGCSLIDGCRQFADLNIIHYLY